MEYVFSKLIELYNRKSAFINLTQNTFNIKYPVKWKNKQLDEIILLLTLIYGLVDVLSLRMVKMRANWGQE